MDTNTYDALDRIMNHLNKGELSKLTGDRAMKSQLLEDFLNVNLWMKHCDRTVKACGHSEWAQTSAGCIDCHKSVNIR